MYWVYLLRNANGKFYVGQSSSLDARVADHNRCDVSEGKFTRKNGPWELVWKESHLTRSSAMVRERQIKSWKSARMIRTKLLGCSE
ncbi:endonuclease [Spartobacteria bacterium LR76]|nr:endonuclease [Spartobacteria bacterium LR76]